MSRRRPASTAGAAPTTPRTIRCAIYTRKSVEKGLEQEFNSLDLQREACDAYLKSQKQAVCYVVRSNVNDWRDDDLWRTYIQLIEAEAVFRIQTSDLSIRPIWHDKESRVRAHISSASSPTFSEDSRKVDGKGRNRKRPRTLLEELQQLQSLDVVLPLDETPKRELKIRCVPRPNRPLGVLLDRLLIRRPERLRKPAPLSQMVCRLLGFWARQFLKRKNRRS